MSAILVATVLSTMNFQGDVTADGGDYVLVPFTVPAGTAEIDVTHAAANKGNALATICELTGIPISQAACIGDGENDTYMFVRAALSVAMGNGQPDTQAKATFVTAPNTEDGFAEAVERYILPRR